MIIAFNQQNIKICIYKRLCSQQSVDPPAYNNNINVMVKVRTDRFKFFWRLSKACSLSNNGLVNFFPKTFMGPHKRFIIKTSREERREYTIDTTDIKIKRGPSILTFYFHPFINFFDSGACIWFRVFAYNLYKSIRFFNTTSINTSGTMIFKTSPN